MLSRVVNEIERYLSHYQAYEDLQRTLQQNDQLTNEELVACIEKIERGIDFFREHFDFKKAELYLKRFEALRGQVLSGQVYVRLAKMMREMNTECYLRVGASTCPFETAQSLD